MTKPYIIVMGASMGGVQAFSRLVAKLPADFPGAIHVVQHSSAHHKSYLSEILSRHGPLPARVVSDGDPIQPGAICVARPNFHLLVKNNFISTPFGPRENRSRPSIDVLFRSAAAYHTTRVIAVLLTGYLDDGVNGLDAVKRCGGMVIVQDPKEAEAPDMPKNAIRQVKVDHILKIDAIAGKLAEAVQGRAGPAIDVPEDIVDKIKISEHRIPDIDTMKKIGDITPYTCPECGGVMWSVRNEPVPRLICHTGHSFTNETFLNGQNEVIENSMWAAIRFIDERVKILKGMVITEQQKGRSKVASGYERKMHELDHHAGILRDFVVSGSLAVLEEKEPLEADDL